ncbi:MAG: AmmeMemoRadiSam system protein B [Candidatus Rokubacteria bacterium]|nr:AmmeMemoRadiSam system protein B [Candidatus Rokubacteria bacterium]
MDVRPSPIAGRWYPREPGRLARSVDAYLDSACLPDLGGTVVAVMAPHAGHAYAGPVAGHAFAAVRGSAPELVAVVGPMHDYHTEMLLGSGHQAYGTPLGIVPVDQAALRHLDARLEAEIGRPLTLVRDDTEHSVEIELPFLQRALRGEFHLLPVMVRGSRPEVVRGLGRALAAVLRDRVGLLVASTDLSHYCARDVADRLDAEVLRRVEALDPDGVLRAEDEGTGFACGAGALAAVLWAARDLGADGVRILRHATSGDVTGEHQEVVGYGAAVVIRRARAAGGKQGETE